MGPMSARNAQCCQEGQALQLALKELPNGLERTYDEYLSRSMRKMSNT